MDQSYRVSLRTRSIAPFLAMAALSLGCAHLPKTGAQDNGQALFVDVKTENIQYVGKVKSGEAVTKDASGNVVGTTEVYEDKLMSYNVTTWGCYQGDDKLDDEDFFRIAGDQEIADKIHNGRDRAVTVNRVGAVMLGVGVVATVAGLVLLYTVKKDAVDSTGKPILDMNGNPTKEPNRTPGSALLYPGILLDLVGGSLMFYGAAAAKREHPFDDPRRARRAAHKYNKDKGLKDPTAAERRKASGRGEEDEQ